MRKFEKEITVRELIEQLGFDPAVKEYLMKNTVEEYYNESFCHYGAYTTEVDNLNFNIRLNSFGHGEVEIYVAWASELSFKLNSETTMEDIHARIQLGQDLARHFLTGFMPIGKEGWFLAFDRRKKEFVPVLPPQARNLIQFFTAKGNKWESKHEFYWIKEYDFNIRLEYDMNTKMYSFKIFLPMMGSPFKGLQDISDTDPNRLIDRLRLEATQRLLISIAD